MKERGIQYRERSDRMPSLNFLSFTIPWLSVAYSTASAATGCLTQFSLIHDPVVECGLQYRERS
ncbi:MAG TPA: hypothetical protein VIR01_04835, partial [Pyrinomonadaceae bacterium]